MLCTSDSCFPLITVIHLSSVVLARCLFLPSLAPHNAPTNNTNASGVSDGAVLSGMGTGKNNYYGSLHHCCNEGACLHFLLFDMP